LVLVEALKQLRAEGPKKTSRVMIDIQADAGLSDHVMSLPAGVRAYTTLVLTMGENGISDEARATMKALRKRCGVALAVVVEIAAGDECLAALESLDAETVIVGRSLCMTHLDGGCRMTLLDIAELCEKQGARLVAEGDFPDDQMASMAHAGVTGFLGRRFQAALTIQSLEDGGCRGQERGTMVPDARVKDLLMHLGRMRALPT
jgi:EAL domain-containing protein (putative c-di-GMP-specific phosphodiesterase class I)